MPSRRQHLDAAVVRCKEETLVILGQSDESYKVYNPVTQQMYTVEAEYGIVISCSCPHSFWRNVCCKHMILVSHVYALEIDELFKIKNI